MAVGQLRNTMITRYNDYNDDLRGLETLCHLLISEFLLVTSFYQPQLAGSQGSELAKGDHKDLDHRAEMRIHGWVDGLLDCSKLQFLFLGSLCGREKEKDV